MNMILRALMVSVWFMALTFPLVVLKVDALNDTILFRWENMASIGVGAFVLSIFWRWSMERKARGAVSTGPSLFARALEAVRQPKPRYTCLGLIAVLMLVMPYISSMYQINIMISALIYIMLGLGLNIVVGLAGQLVLGYAAFYAVGAYTYGLLNTYFGLGFWAVLPVGGIMAALFGLMLGFPVLRLKGDYLAIVTLGFGEIIRLVLENWTSVTKGSFGLSNLSRPSLFGMEMGVTEATNYIYYIVLAAVVVTIIVVGRLKNSRIGLALQALREDEIACEAMGIDLTKVKLSAFALGSCWAGFAGVIFAAKTTFINPASFTFMESAMVLSMVARRHGFRARRHHRGGHSGARARIPARVLRIPYAPVRRGHGHHDDLPSSGPHFRRETHVQDHEQGQDRQLQVGFRRSCHGRPGMNTPVLEVTNLSKNFGGLRALNEVDLTINRQEIVALIGPNGAGKTTFFNCITGIYLPTEGTVQLHLPERNGKPASSTTLNGMKPNEITSLGMARTFQNIRLFPTMTVLENVMIGRHCRTSAGIAGAVFQDSRTKAEEQATIDRSYELLREVGLNMHYQDEARNLPYGAQRRLEIARALATDPAVLLLDEPAAGMNPQETLELKSLILHLRKEFDLSILLIEHDMGMVMSLSDRIYVMEYGSRIAMGTPQEVRENPRVIKAYLGESDHA